MLYVTWRVQELSDLEAAVREHNPSIAAFESSCFDGRYVTGAVSEQYLEQLALQRLDNSAAAAAAGRQGRSACSIALSVDAANVLPPVPIAAGTTRTEPIGLYNGRSGRDRGDSSGGVQAL